MGLDDSPILEKIQTVKHWYHQIEIKPGLVTPGVQNSSEILRLLNFPNDCSGLKALDLGARDGFFSFELEKRGAEVLALDYYPSDKTGFKVAAELLDSKVTYVQDNFYNVSVEKYGTFDIVLFLGLIYHLPDPLRSLDIVRKVCTNELYLETQVIDNAFLKADGTFVQLSSVSEELDEIPIMQFYPKNSLLNDPTSYWAPNLKCMELMLNETNFSVLEKHLYNSRGLFKCQVTSDDWLTYHMELQTGVRYPRT